MKLIKYFLEFLIVIFFFTISKILGLKKSSYLFSKIFKKIGPHIRSSKKIEKNILIAFPKLNQEEIQSIMDQMWSNYGGVFAEYMHLNFLRKNKYNNVEIKGLAQLNELKNLKKPILFFSAHLANFELLAMYLEKKGFNISALYRPLNNPFLNPIMEYLRKKHICQNQIPKTIPGISKYKYAARELISKIKKGENIALMVDQKVTQGIKVNFFGKEALTMNLPAQMAIKYNYILQPLSIKRNMENNFYIKIENPINVDNEDDEYSITCKINNKIEEIITKNPGEWIWTHDRWRI